MILRGSVICRRFPLPVRFLVCDSSRSVLLDRRRVSLLILLRDRDLELFVDGVLRQINHFDELLNFLEFSLLLALVLVPGLIGLHLASRNLYREFDELLLVRVVPCEVPFQSGREFLVGQRLELNVGCCLDLLPELDLARGTERTKLIFYRRGGRVGIMVL